MTVCPCSLKMRSIRYEGSGLRTLHCRHTSALSQPGSTATPWLPPLPVDNKGPKSGFKSGYHDNHPPSFLIGCELMGRCPSVCSGGQALGAVFNQLVRSRAQLLGAVVCSK